MELSVDSIIEVSFWLWSVRVEASCVTNEAKTYDVIGDGDQQLLEDDTGIFIHLDKVAPVLWSATHVVQW